MAIAREVGLVPGDLPAERLVKERIELSARLVSLALQDSEALFSKWLQYSSSVREALGKGTSLTPEELLRGTDEQPPFEAETIARFRFFVAVAFGKVLSGSVMGLNAGRELAEKFSTLIETVSNKSALSKTGTYQIAPVPSSAPAERPPSRPPELRGTPPEPGRDQTRRRGGSDSARTELAHVMFPGTEGAPRSATLILLESPEGTVDSLFRKISSGLTVGRAATNDWCLDHVSVSRTHAAFDRTDAFYLQDLGSTNGTFVNEERITSPKRLRSDDKIIIGNYRFKFIVGDIAQERLFEEVNDVLTKDRLTGAFNLSYFEQELRREAERAAHFGRPLSLISIKLDGLDAINDDENTEEGDRIIKHAVDVCRSQFGAVARLGRHSASIYGALPEVPFDEAQRLGAAILGALKENAQQVRGRFKVSVGVATQVSSQAMAAALRQRSEEAQRRATALGGNRVEALEMGGTAVSRKIRRDPKHVVHRALADAPGRALVILEMASSVALFENLNAEQREARFAQLMDNVLEETSATDDVSSWHKQYVVASVPEPSAQERQRFVDRVRARWLKNVVEDDDLESRAPRQLRAAWLSTEEVVRFSDGCLDELRMRLLKTAEQREGPQAKLVARLPFVVAGPVSMIQAAHGQALRFEAARFAVERCFQFLSFTALALIRDQRDSQKWEQTRRILAPLRENLTMGAWANVAIALSKQVSPKGRLFSVFQEFAGSGDKVGDVVKMIEGAVQVRNSEAHGVPRLDPEAVAPRVEQLLDTGGALLSALSPVSKTRLVSFQGVNGNLPNGGQLLDVREHTGPGEHFPMQQVEFSKPLFEKKWCHLIEGKEDPISLAPWMRAEPCQVCGRVELFVATHFLPNAKGEIGMVGVTSGHPNVAVAPAAASDAEFWAFVRQPVSARQ